MLSLGKPRIFALLLVMALSTQLGCGGTAAMTSLLEVAGVAAVVSEKMDSGSKWINIAADVISGKAVVRVIAKLIKQNDPTPVTVILVQNKDGKYEGTYDTATPTADQPVIYTAVVEATDASGDTAKSAPVVVEVTPSK